MYSFYNRNIVQHFYHYPHTVHIFKIILKLMPLFAHASIKSQSDQLTGFFGKFK